MNINNNIQLNIFSRKNRIVEIDYLKAFAIMLVVFGHFLESFNSSYSNVIYQLIYMFHMPLFVFISGYLSKFKFKDLLKFLVIYLLFYFMYSIFNYFIMDVRISFNLYYPYWLLWYLLSLMIWKLSLPLLDKISNENKGMAVAFLFVLGLCIGEFGFINRIFSMSRTLAFFPFFALGYFNRKSGSFGFDHKKGNIAKSILIVLILILFAILIKLKLFSSASLYMADPYSGPTHSIFQRLLIYIFSLTMIYLLSSISIKKKSKIIELISQNTLTIFLMHGFIIILFKHYRLLANKNISIIFSFILSVVVVLTFTYVGKLISIIKKYFQKNI